MKKIVAVKNKCQKKRSFESISLEIKEFNIGGSDFQDFVNNIKSLSDLFKTSSQNELNQYFNIKSNLLFKKILEVRLHYEEDNQFSRDFYERDHFKDYLNVLLVMIGYSKASLIALNQTTQNDSQKRLLVRSDLLKVFEYLI